MYEFMLLIQWVSPPLPTFHLLFGAAPKVGWWDDQLSDLAAVAAIHI